MPQPAARLGDPTAHGTPLAPGPGSPNVLIGGQPAWRAGMDSHACPLFTGPVPHSKETTIPTAVMTLINFMPAARMGDVLQGSGPPNTHVMGHPMTLIGP